MGVTGRELYHHYDNAVLHPGLSRWWVRVRVKGDEGKGEGGKAEGRVRAKEDGVNGERAKRRG